MTKGVFAFCRSPIQRTNEALFRQRSAGSAAAAGVRESAAATRQATGAMQAQSRMTSLTTRGLHGVGRAWKIAIGPVGWVITVLEVLYNAFQPVRTVVDWIIAAVSSIPVIGPIVKTIANSLGFGGDIPDYETAGAEGEAVEPVLEARAATPKTAAPVSVQSPPPPKEFTAPAEGWSDDPYMQMYQIGKAAQPAQTATEPSTAKAWYDPSGWFGSDESVPAPTVAQPMQTASGSVQATVAVQPEAVVQPMKTVSVASIISSRGVQPEAVVQPMKTAPVEPEPQKTEASLSYTGTPPSSAQIPAARDKQTAPARSTVAAGAALPGTSVSLTQEITLNGITDADFARRVMDAVKARKSDFEHLLSSIVDDQRRLAYGR